jgi:ubiquinol-cytochrome c reductase cytochrome c subunit
MPMANPGAQAPRKENVYTDEEVAAIAAFVASLGPGPGIPTSDQYSGEGLSAEELAKGGELFRTNCSACHNFEGAGGALPNGKYAPSLKGVDGKIIWQAMRTGPQQMPVFSSGALPDEDVRAIVGYLETLHAQPSSGLTFGALGPVSEGLYAWIIGIGGLCLIAVWIAAKGARAK